jgi:argininosuccinate lyase
MAVDSSRAQALLQKGHLLATDLANHLALRGVPFREAYRQVAALVQAADGAGCSIEELPSSVVSDLAPGLPAEVICALSFPGAVEARRSRGGTGLEEARTGIEALRRIARAG